MRLTLFTASALGGLLFAASAGAQGPTARPTIKLPPAAPKSAPVVKPAPPSAQAPRPGLSSASTTGYIQGVALDSIHGTPLVSAIIQAEGTDRLSISDSLGRFLLDSVKPGSYRVLVDHAILDTLGIILTTQPMTVGVNEVTRVTIAVPSGEFLAGRFCTPARRSLGPGVLVGRIREPDSENAAVGARVSLVWYDPDPPSIAGFQVKVKKVPRVREASVGEDGTYRLCGLPEKYEGKLQAQRKDGGTTAEVSIAQDEGVLALRSMSVAPLAVATAGDSGKAAVRNQKGSARVFGRVTNKAGAPVANARVGLVGGSAAALTRSNGEFLLDSLPAGTQALIVRQLGYAPTEVTVELSSRTPSRVTVQMGAYVPELTAVAVVSKRDAGLDRVGFLSRKNGAQGGHFITPEQIESRRASHFTDLLTTVPGIRIQGNMGQRMISSTRNAGRAGCVMIYVDGNKWQQLSGGDLDSFLRPDDIAAIEVYQSGSSTPVEFSSGGQDCSTVVAWSKQHVLRSNNRK